MSTSRRVTQHKTAPSFGFKALADEGEGVFEAYVSVFGNVDLAGERVVVGAFSKSLERWAASGDPIPVIFSHQWDTLEAHVGKVLVAEEHMPGDPRLPAELAELGGLYVKAAMDVEEDFAGRLWKRMAERRLREFSFAYDVIRAKPGAGGALDLLELDVIEVGPTLKGMNPATVLVSAKAFGDLGDASAATRGMLALTLLDLADALVKSDGPDDDEPADDEPEAPETDAGDADGTKRLPAAALEAGAVEPVLAAIRESATVWAELEFGRDFYALHLEGTYLAEGRAIVTAERWQDPLGEGPVYELSFSFADDGTVSIDSATELELTVELTAKRLDTRRAEMAAARAALDWRVGKASAIGERARSTVPDQGKAEPGGKAETMTTAARAAIDVELIELEAMIGATS